MTVFFERMRAGAFGAALVAGATLAAPVAAAPVTVNFTTAPCYTNSSGTSPCTQVGDLDGSDGNVRRFQFRDQYNLLTNVKVTAWSADQDQSGNADNSPAGLSNYRTAFLGEYGGGLGVTNRNEGNGADNNSHTADNIASIDFIVMKFDTNVVVTGAQLNAFAMTAFGYTNALDTDASFFFGSVEQPWASNVDLRDAAQRLSVLSNYTDTTGPGSNNFRSVNGTTRYEGNVFVITPSIGNYLRDYRNGDRPDGFKLETIKVETILPTDVPEPAIVGLLGLGVAAVALRRRRA